MTVRLDLSRGQLVDALKAFAAEAAQADWAWSISPAMASNSAGRITSCRSTPLDLRPRRLVRGGGARSGAVRGRGRRKLRLIILDACRDNPFAKTMKRGIGPARSGADWRQIEPEGATLVAYAAKHGQTAEDGEAGNSPFVRRWSSTSRRPGVEINLLFRKVRDDVLKATSRQEPFTYGSLPSDPFYFRKQ